MSHSFIWVVGSGLFDAAANWSDLTLGADPAPAPPGSLDTAVIAGPASGFQTITGPGSAASLSFTGDDSLAGALSLGSLSVGVISPGTLDIGAGASVGAGSATLGSGQLAVSGSGATLAVSGTLSLDTGILSVSDGGAVQAAALTLNGGTIAVDPTGVLQIGAAGNVASGLLSIDAGAMLISMGGVVSPGIALAGTLLASGGTTALFGSVTGAGTLLVGAGATLFAGNAVAASVNAGFSGVGGTMLIYPAGGGFAATIAGFAAGDAIDVSGIAADAASFAANGAGGGALTLSEAGATVATLSLAGLYSGVLTLPDGVDGTLLLLASGSIAAGGALSAGTSGADVYQWNAAGGGMWDIAANWQDVSARTTPAQVAPGSKNIVTLAGPTGTSVALIGGPGNSASLIVTGAIALSGSFATGGFTLGAARLSGTLDILAGATLTSTTPSVADGTLELDGAGALFSVNGILTEGPQTAGLPPPDITVLDGAYLKVHLMILAGGTIGADATGTIEIGTPGNAAAGALTVDAGYYIHSTGGTITGAVIDKGTIQTIGGETSMFGAVSGPGLLTVGAGGTLFLAGTVASTDTVSFIAAGGTLLLDGTAPGFAAVIAGFASGDAIDISGLALSGTTWSAGSGGQGTLALSSDGTVVLSLILSGNFAGALFQTSPDAVDGTLISLASGGSGAGLLSAGTSGPDDYGWAAASGGDWGTAANWLDTTQGGTAAVAPGSNDIVAIAGLGGASALLLTGHGAAASLALSGNVALAARVATGAVTIGSGLAATLDIDATGSLGAASLALDAGVLDVSGVGATLTVSGMLTLGPAATGSSGPGLTVADQGGVQAAALTLNGGTITVDGVSVLEIGTANTASSGLLTVDAGATLASSGGVIGSAVSVGGLLLAQSGITGLLSDADGTGTLAVGAGATLSIYGVVAAGITLAFDGAGGRLILNATTNAVSGVIAGFAPGDEIDIAASDLTGASFTASGNGGTLALTADGALVASLTLAGSYSPTTFQTLPDGVDGTLIEAPCYVAGTRILTAAGERRVEELRPGERLATLSGRLAPVRWVGRRRVKLIAHSNAATIQPVRICAGAFGIGMPNRDLMLSPAHAVSFGGGLIPVHLLVNGMTIISGTGWREVTYVHVELDRHEVILAEGLPAESYLDTGNRSGFAEALGACPLDAALLPDQALAIWAARGAAPLVLGGAALAAAREHLAEQAMRLGWRPCTDPGLHLRADGMAIWPQRDGASYRFAPPRVIRRMVLCSRSTLPGARGDTDQRRLGVAVRRIAADGEAFEPTGEGWHAAEPGWRWTDGAAVVDCAGARMIVLELVPMQRYWVAPELLSQARLAAR